MAWKMVTENETRHLQTTEQLFAYADAYLLGSIKLCESMIEQSLPYTWPSGSMVLMLAAHATELILKGAIVYREPSGNVLAAHGQHDLISLARRYTEAYPEPELAWEIPFQTDELSIVRELDTPASIPPSILYRYPNQKGKSAWPGLYGFEAHSFLEILKNLRSDFRRIRPLILESVPSSGTGAV
jgi:hypothetical protein